MPKKLIKKLPIEVSEKCNIGEEIVKRSLKPFPSGARVVKVLGITECPFTLEPAYLVSTKAGESTTVAVKGCIPLKNLDGISLNSLSSKHVFK